MDRRLDEHLQVRNQFWRSLDLGLIKQILGNLPRANKIYLSFLAEGMHFKVYKILGTSPLPLALSVGKPEFTEAVGFHHWLANIEKIRKIDWLLCPPFELVRDDETVGIVMPHMEGDLTRIPAHWLPLSEEVEAFKVKLAKLGLAINDTLQIRSCQSVPFVHDFSDLVGRQ